MTKTYHIIIEANGEYPSLETPIVPYAMEGANLQPYFFLYSPDYSDTKWCALTIEEPYEHEEGSAYTSANIGIDDMAEVIAQAVYVAKATPEDTSLRGEYIATTPDGYAIYKKEVVCELIDDEYKVVFYTVAKAE